MVLNVFAVYDSKTRAYFQPYFSPTVDSAMRTFSDDVNNPQSVFHKHPEDFSLFHVGSFDNLSGIVVPLSPHATLGKALDFLKGSDVPSLAVQTA